MFLSESLNGFRRTCRLMESRAGVIALTCIRWRLQQGVAALLL
jgi:hypothetical protein